MTTPREADLPKMETKKMRKGGGSLNLVTSPIPGYFFYTDLLFYFFIFISLNSYCLLYHIIHVLESFKNFQITLLSIVAYYLFACYNRRSQYNRKQIKSVSFDKVVHFVSEFRTPPLCSFVEHLSIFS